MNMTDIEQKALELVKRLRARRSPNYKLLSNGPQLAPDRDCQEAADWIEAHAAEMREQAERFSEAAKRMVNLFVIDSPERLAASTILSPFILAPVNPLVEALGGAGFSQLAIGRVEAALDARGLAIVKKEAVNG